MLPISPVNSKVMKNVKSCIADLSETVQTVKWINERYPDSKNPERDLVHWLLKLEEQSRDFRKILAKQEFSK